MKSAAKIATLFEILLVFLLIQNTAPAVVKTEQRAQDSHAQGIGNSHQE